MTVNAGIYFVRCVETGNVKIGWSSHIRSRFHALRTGNPLTLELAAVMPTSQDTERRLHEAFADSRVNGEWFAMSAPLQMLIVALASVFPVGAASSPPRNIRSRPIITADDQEAIARARSLIIEIAGPRRPDEARPLWLERVSTATGIPLGRIKTLFYGKAVRVRHTEMVALEQALPPRVAAHTDRGGDRGE